MSWVGLKKELEQAKKKGVKVKTIYLDCNIHRSHLDRIISGKTKPNKEVIEVLSKYLDITEEHIEKLIEKDKETPLINIKEECIEKKEEVKIFINLLGSIFYSRKIILLSSIASLFLFSGFSIIYILNHEKKEKIPSEPSKLSPKLNGDSSEFVKDVTIPDGTNVLTNFNFKKIWRIKNTGSIFWKRRYLMRVTPFSDLTCHSEHIVPIKDTPPGEEVNITVNFRSMNLPGSCRTDWKMVDRFNTPFFLNKHGLYSIVHVTEDKTLIKDNKPATLVTQ